MELKRATGEPWPSLARLLGFQDDLEKKAVEWGATAAIFRPVSALIAWRIGALGELESDEVALFACRVE
jgi:hypothetical protein